jgi:hypothetical protein
MYKKEDFDNLYWNPFGNPKGVRKLWNTLNLYNEFNQNLVIIDEDLFFNYMELVYHKDSIMVKDYDNVNDRKIKAFEFLLEESFSKFPSGVKRIINGDSSTANKMCIRFCTMQKSQEYALLATSYIAYDKLLFEMERNLREDDISEAIIMTEKTQGSLEKMLNRINELKKTIFMSDKIIESEVDDDLLKYARVEGITELIVKGKINIPKR